MSKSSLTFQMPRLQIFRKLFYYLLLQSHPVIISFIVGFAISYLFSKSVYISNFIVFRLIFSKRKAICKNYFQEKFLNLDRFSAPVQLNVNGQDKISSYPGTILTICLLIVLTIYGVQKFRQWVLISDPQINISTFTNEFDYQHVVNLTEQGVKFAFGVQQYGTNIPIDDPNYVQWEVSILEYVNKKRT